MIELTSPILLGIIFKTIFVDGMFHLPVHSPFATYLTELMSPTLSLPIYVNHLMLPNHESTE